ncbi:phage head closure protein [Clostridium botulinum]|uniref:Putative phage head-tail adaptor n=1 Tax=Clostridium botulinum (strain Langeland / NCTC 10281 / Type F) TaxID=441772 RepID=A7GI67_CLOBL|nr:phage head closure protein [Clostridium botulinum]ABS41407.1 putative phage head-tail adaptor [Clostridium botulinum F str. Langeland]ADG00840.1 putative phage head-tail adaptor [Clostridium botulinum F str. 230613]KKM40655.1 head-tail adaptor protein [Clostridium botulinum]MBY6794371.1 phage head closure protein [Clostridium botulinum]MBY6938159.1 phage head closure protein [Clostridium botulinum]
MDPGKLNKRIKFIIIENGTDDEGYPIKGEKTIRECWASVRGLRGREFYNAAAVQSEQDKIFNCRYFKGLDTSLQIKYKNKFYDITSINDLNERHVEYEIHAKEVKASG